MPTPPSHTPADIAQRFKAHFGKAAEIYSAPGRVNLIGEHTDYNDGYVMPAAINLFCWVGVAPRGDRKLVIYAENYKEQVEVDLDALTAWVKRGSASYPVGVAWSLEQAGHGLRGCDLYIAGDVPLGSGLSSSAAIEVATAMALLEASGIRLDRTKMALLCQRAENEFVGARCGIMDQFISCHGKAEHALLLDCRSLEARAIPLPASATLVVCNTMVKHDLTVNEYNNRRAECEEGVRLLKKALPAIVALRDVSSAQLEQHHHLLPGKTLQRCRHVVTENERVLRAATAFEKGDFPAIARLMADSHNSLRDDYEVSCRELDQMVEIAGSQKGVLGARMTGGGFGGCTINLVEHGAVETFVDSVAREYQLLTGLQSEIYTLKAAHGAMGVTLSQPNHPLIVS
jgi:galactokinase